MNPAALAEPQKTVIVVDDNPLNLELLRQDLEEAGYKTITALSGSEALAAMQSVSPCLVLLDIMMPGISGLDVLREIRRAPATRELPVILVSAKSESGDVVEGLRSGANDYVTKPIDIEVLLARMETQLRLRALKEELERRNERIRRDLQEARRVQVSLMPDPAALEAIPGSYGLRIFASNRSAGAVGCDFWDALPLADGALGLILADFSGSGLIPALNTFRLKTFLHASCVNLSNAGLALARIHAHLLRFPGRREMATCNYGIFDPESRRLQIASAGGSPLWLSRRGAPAARAIGGGGRPIGLFPEAEYEEAEIELAPGDTLLLYSDGLLKLPDSASEPLGERRLRELFERAAPEGAPAVNDLLARHADSCAQRAPLSDDLTWIALDLPD